jgi:hypothetical protein
VIEVSVSSPDDGTHRESIEMLKIIEAKTWQSPRLATTAAGAISVALASLPGAVLAAASVWDGFATVTAATTKCSGVSGAAPGDTHVSVFRPKIASTEGPTFLSFVFLRGAVTHENTSEATVHQMNGLGNYSGFLVGSHAAFSQYTGTYDITLFPAVITAETPSVTINGTINNFLNVSGCDVSFVGTYAERFD